MSGYIKTCPNCGEYVLPAPIQLVTGDASTYKDHRAECVVCRWTGFTDELIPKFIRTTLVGEPAFIPPISLEFLGESATIAGEDPQIDNITLNDGDWMIVVYSRQILSFGGNPTATWNGQNVGSQFGWGNNPEEQQASFTLFNKDLWMVVFVPSSGGTGSLVVSEPGSASPRILHAYRMRGAGAFFTMSALNDQASPSITYAPSPSPTREEAVFFMLAAGVASDDSSIHNEQWSGANRIRNSLEISVGTSLVMDVSYSEYRSPFVATYGDMPNLADIGGGIIMGFRP